MPTKQKSEFEFIALMALLMGNAALAIDAVLPGLNGIGKSLNVTEPNELQLVITMILVGLGTGQLIFGTLSDSLGRKPMVYAGVVTFILASIICVLSDSLVLMLIGRVLQGIGLSGPRSISISIIRDAYKGDQMARIMSFITVVFILVPMIAPLIGQFILNYYSWHYIFLFQIFIITIAVIWFKIRQEETLKPENKRVLTKALFFEGLSEFMKYKSTIIYTLVSGVIGGGFFVYLSASKQVFIDQYGLKDGFGYVFATLAFSMGVASFLNSSLVVKFGMKKLAIISLLVFFGASSLFVILFSTSGNPGLPVIMSFFAVQFMALGFIFGNVRSLAMDPIGHIAGIGAAINGFVSTLMSVPIAIYIGSFISTSALPIFAGFAITSAVCLVLIIFDNKPKR